MTGLSNFSPVRPSYKSNWPLSGSPAYLRSSFIWCSFAPSKTGVANGTPSFKFSESSLSSISFIEPTSSLVLGPKEYISFKTFLTLSNFSLFFSILSIRLPRPFEASPKCVSKI